MSLYGVYWEYEYDYENTIASFLFIPEYAVKRSGRADEVVPASLVYRTVSDAAPQKSYRFHHGEATNAALVGTFGDPATLAVQMSPQLSIFSEPIIQSVDGNPDFHMKSDPIYLEITDEELETIREDATPRSLTARLYRARTATGYPALPGKES